MKKIDCLNAPSSSLWTGRQDTPPNERYFQKVSCLPLQSLPDKTNPHQLVLIGFETDEGIVRNLGRPGAQKAPNEIRQALGRLASHQPIHIFDVGNQSCPDHDLENATKNFSEALRIAHQKGYKTIVLGGGHEVAYGHYKGLEPYWGKLGIINFDAHFDLRGDATPTLTSGTPFAKIAAEAHQNNHPFHYCVVGIQPQANTQSLYDKAHALHVEYLEAQPLMQMPLADKKQFLNRFIDKVDAIYLTLCMDVFAQTIAPGVSAPQPLGLYPDALLPLLNLIASSKKLISIDLVEVSPPWDEDQKTIKLAAELLAYLIEQWHLSD